MSDTPKISIIVPVYNMEKYLEECLNSLIAQSLKEIEIILVNDGSTDASLDICDKFSYMDARIKVYSKENGGLSDARNYGLRYSTAEYVGFIDADDYIDCDFYEKLYYGMIENAVDISIAQIKKTDDIGEILFVAGYKDKGKIGNIEIMKSMLTAKGVSNSVCNKLFKKSLFSIDPFPIGKLYEDEYVTYKIVDKCNYIYFTNEVSYYYRTNQSSITHAKFSKKEIHRIEASLIRIEYLKHRHTELLDDAKRYLMYDCLTAISKMDKYELEYNKLILSNVRKNLLVYLKGRSSIGAKIFAIITAISPKLSIFMYKILLILGKES